MQKGHFRKDLLEMDVFRQDKILADIFSLDILMWTFLRITSTMIFDAYFTSHK